jgi:hypothetical protein
VKEVTVVATSIADLDPGQLAQLLFAGPVQPSEQPSPAAIRMALAAQFRLCQGDLAAALAVVAQEAGDHPDSYAARMRWAIGAVGRAFAGRPGNRVAVGRAA